MNEKNDEFIKEDIDKEPLFIKLSDDSVINITGESGSGKSFYTNKYLNDNNYIVIDTDLIFSNKDVDNKYILELRNVFVGMDKLELINNFDDCYFKIIKSFKDMNKTLVIDSAQFRNVKDINILVGEIIVLRTSIDKCYDRCIKRYIANNKNLTEDELQQYKKRKYNIYEWYHGLNDFISRLIDVNNK